MATHCAIHALDLPCPACAEVAAAEAKGYKAGKADGRKEGLLEAAVKAEIYGSQWGEEDIPLEWQEFVARLRAIAEKG